MPLLHLANYGRIEADAEMEQEVAGDLVGEGDTDADASRRRRLERAQQLRARGERIERNPQGPSEHVRRATGQRCECRVGADEALRRLVERAVAREHHHGVDLCFRGFPRQVRRVVARRRRRDLEIMVDAQRR